MMFGVPIETIAPGEENYHLRQKGKVAELALGYQGSTGALIQMGALDMGLTEEELRRSFHFGVRDRRGFATCGTPWTLALLPALKRGSRKDHTASRSVWKHQTKTAT